MDRSDTPLPVVAAPAPGDAWLTRSDELLWAINHALNNRLAALGSLVRVLESTGPASDPLLTMLGEEVERLDRVLVLLRLLPRDRDEEAEPLLLSDLLPQVLALHRLQGDAHEVDYDAAGAESLLPVLVARTSLVRALLLLLAAPGSVPRGERTSALRLHCGGDAEEVVVSMAMPPRAEGEAGGGESAPTAAAALAIEGLLVGSGGRLMRREADAAAPASVELRLPTLPAARRAQALAARERE